ncbi:hypothetical protein [Kribbella sp. NPDC004536]|uniref:hypothetical protein n=1 Tax=Kribbella sp. NPDC004536 TaxID=3364106 RepID=UPI00369A1262
MKRFVVPPDWPIPPRCNWIPPKTWRPDPSWPPAPPGWRFWVDGRGKPVLGPVGRYGGPSRRAVYAGVAALLVFAGVNLWAVTAIGLFDGKPDDSAAVKFAERTTPPPPRVTSPAAPQTTVTPPLVPSTIVVPTVKSVKPTKKPTASRTTERNKPTPRPTRTTTKPPTPKPTRPTAQPSTSDELLRQYCIQHGIDPAWCDPTVWQRHP